MASRQTYYAESLAESTTTSSTYQDKVSLTFTPDANTDYILFWSAGVIEVSTTVSVFSRLYNSTDAVVLSEQNQENRTTSGSPYRITGGMAKFSAGASPVSTTFKIQFHDSDGASTAKIKNARILAVRVDALDAYAESLSDQTSTSNTYEDGASLTFTPGSTGDYLIFATCDFNHGSTGDEMFIKLLDPDGSTSYCELQHVNRDAANYNPYFAMVKKNLTASSKTFKLQVHRTSANTITLKNQRLYAMRLDAGFANAYYAEDRTRATTTSTTFQDDNSLTQSTNAADHLIFNCAGLDGTLNSESQQCQFLEDGNVMSGPFEARVNTSATYSYYYPLFIAYKETLTAASHTWKRQFKTVTGTATAGINEDATAVLEISAGGITASLSQTEENDSAAISAKIKITDSVAITEENDSSSASSAVKDNSTVNASEENDGCSSSSAVLVNSTVAQTEEDDSQAATVQLIVTGTVNASEDDDGCSSSAQVKITNSAAITEESDSSAISAQVRVTGGSTPTESDDTASGAAQVQITCYLGRAKTPTDISGLIAWYDAQDASTITMDGSNLVSQWSDKSSNANHVTQSTSANKPKYVYSAINSLPALQGYHDGTNPSCLSITDNSSLVFSNYTIFTVFQRVTDRGTLEDIVAKYATVSGSNREFIHQISSGDKITLTQSRDGTATFNVSAQVASPTTVVGNPILSFARFDNTANSLSVGMWYLGTKYTNSNTQTDIANTVSPLSLFCRLDSTIIDGIAGYIGEVIIFDSALSTADQLAIWQYLDQKWNLGFNPAYSALEEDDSTSSSSLVKITSSVAATEENDSSAISAQVKITTSVNATEQDDSSSGNITGVNSVDCSVNATEADDAVSSNAQVKLIASVNLTEEDDNSTIAAKIQISETVAVTEEDDAISTSSKVLVSSSVNTTEQDDYSTIATFVKISSSINTTEEDDVSAITGKLLVAANSNDIEEDDACTGSSQVRITAAVNTSESDDSSAGLAAVKILIVANCNEEDDGSDVESVVVNPTVAPPERTLYIEIKNRLLKTKVCNRLVYVQQQARKLNVKVQNRKYSATAGNRLY